MDNKENKNQEWQEFAKDMKNEMEALVAKTMNEMYCMFEKAMERQEVVAE